MGNSIYIFVVGQMIDLAEPAMPAILQRMTA